MTNRDKVNALSNREMAVLWDYIKSDCAGSNCVFYACPDCGGDCLKGFEAWLGLECEAEENPPADNKAEKLSKKLETVFMTNGDKIKSMDNAELAKVLCQSKEFDKCNYCSYLTSDTLYCHKESCVDGIKAWLESPTEENQPADNVNHPAHYTSGQIEVIDFIEDKGLGFHLGNAVKYISRAGRKNPDNTIEDLRKAVWYINRQIQRLECGGDLGGQNS